jgi:hypothetical protein
MRMTLVVALAAVLAASASSSATAQYACPPGYAFYGGVCQPMGSPGYSNPVSGAVSGEAAGAASGYRAAGPVGAVPRRRLAPTAISCTTATVTRTVRLSLPRETNAASRCSRVALRHSPLFSRALPVTNLAGQASYRRLPGHLAHPALARPVSPLFNAGPPGDVEHGKRTRAISRMLPSIRGTLLFPALNQRDETSRGTRGLERHSERL